MILAACETHWLYAARPGLNWALTTLAVALGFLLARLAAGKTPRREVLTALALACLIACGAAVTADPANELLIAATVLFALGSAVMADYTGGQASHRPLGWALAAPLAAPLAAAEAGRRFTEAVGFLSAGRGIAAMRGIALAMPITVMLAVLLSQADPTLAAWRDLAREAWRDFALLPRGLFFCVLAVCLLGTFGIALRPAAPSSAAAPTATAPRLFGDTERLIILGSVAGLFGLFLVLQVSYLFGNPGGRAGSGVSYADAVHRGFVELNIASSVCGALLLLLARHAQPGAQQRWVRALQWTVSLQAQILLVSAFYRVLVYEEAYGFTRLRLLVQVYAAVAFVVLGLLSSELRSYPRPDRLLRRSLVVITVALAVLIYGNYDAWIAHADLQRYGRTGRIDVSYLTSGLGPDAVPELVQELPRLPRPVAAQIAAGVRTRYPQQTSGAVGRWFEWSLRRAQLERAMTTLRDDPHFAAGSKADLKTTPSFITNATFFSALTSASGSPATAIRSADAPAATTPSSPRWPSSSAAREVADWIACIGVMPNSTSRPNSWAIGSVQTKPPTSVPNAILTPARSAFWNDTPCTATRLRSRLPLGVSGGSGS